MTIPPSPAAAPARARRRDAAENRTAILAAAASLLNQDREASLEAIAAAAGLTRRAVYGHFANRDALIREMIALGAARVARSVVDGDDADSRIAIARIGERLWREIDDVRVMAQFAVRGPFSEIVASGLAPVRRQLLAAVERGIRSHEIRQDIAPDRLSRLIEGAAVAVLDEANRFPLDSEEGARLVIHAGLGVAGLSWAEAHDVITRMDHSA